MSKYVRRPRPQQHGRLNASAACVLVLACNTQTTETAGTGDLPASAVQPVIASQRSPKPVPNEQASELVVKFHSSGPHAVTECPEVWLKKRRSFRDATADGSDSLDIGLRNWKVRDARALLPGRTGLSTAAALRQFHDRRAAARSAFAQRSARTASNADAARADVVNIYRLRLDENVDPDRAAKDLGQDPHVEFAQPNYRIRAAMVPNDPFFASKNSWGQGYDDLWGVKKIGAPAAWDTTQGETVVVAVIDSGVDRTHPDLSANLWTNAREVSGNGIDDDKNGFVDDVHGWNFASDSDDPTDDNGHGTHVSGTIAAVGNNGQGIIGVAPKARILPIKALDAAGYGTSAALAQAIIYAAQNGADVINNSWSCAQACPSNRVIEDAVVAAHDLGATVVFAAGNSSSDIAAYSPQNRPEVIVVSATDANDQRTSFSNFGLVDVAAPGGAPDVAPPSIQPSYNVLSLRSTSCSPAVCQPGFLIGSNLLRLGGTSMAAPHVSGLAALILKRSPSYSPEEVRQVIRKSAVDIGSAGLDLDSGYGRISANAAVARPRPLSALITAPATELSGFTQVEVTGTAQGTGLASWRLEFASGSTPTAFTRIASSTTPVNHARLATWNLANVPDGLQTLRVVATDTSGRTYEDRQLVTLDNVKIAEPPSGGLSIARAGDVVSVIGTVSPANFIGYSISISRSDGTPFSGGNVVLQNGGTRKVVNGVLGTWNTAGIPADEYNLSLNVHVAGGTLTDGTSVIVDPTLHTGWPRRLGDSGSVVQDALTAADLNADGAPEIIVGHGDRICVFDHAGNALPGWPQLVGGGFIERAPSVGDVTGDGIVEVVAANDRGQAFVLSASGAPLSGWPRALGGGGISVALDDIDGNGPLEVIAVTAEGQVHVLRGNGTSLPGWPQSVGVGVLSSPAIADVQANGSSKEIVVATLSTGGIDNSVGTLRIFNANGTPLPSWPITLPAMPVGEVTTPYQSAPVLGDIDGDGDLEIVVGTVTGSVHAYHHDGRLVAGWPKNSASSIIHPASPIALADFDGDGSLDVIAGRLIDHSPVQFVFTNDLEIWRGNGTSLAGWPVSRQHLYSSSGFAAPIVADVDGDGVLDVLSWSDEDPTSHAVRSLNAYRRDANAVVGFPKLTPGLPAGTLYWPSNSPIVGDFDRDGKLELALLDALSNLLVWDLDGPATPPAPWPAYQRDARHSGHASASSGLGGAGGAGGASNTGGRTSTGGGGAGGSGADENEPCTPAATITGGQSGNFNTSGPYCFRTPDNIAGWGCSNFDGRSVAINTVTKDCGAMPLPARFNGYYYFQISTGTYPWASIYWW